MQQVAIVSAVRTGIGSFLGSLKQFTAVELGASAISAAIERAHITSADVEDVVMGNVLQAGSGQNPARQAALQAGLPVTTTAMTINQVCGSGLKAVHLACQSIMLGEHKIVVAGGMESMSNAPHVLRDGRLGSKMGDMKLIDSMAHDGLWCSIEHVHMGITAENIARKFGISREAMDSYAYESSRKALAANGRFDDEMIELVLNKGKKNEVSYCKDEHIRDDSSLEKLARLKPAFLENGSITAGNSSGINDGAAALVLMSLEEAASRGIKPLAIIRGNASAGVEPSLMGLGPVPAIKDALQRAGLQEGDIDLVELNEAFAAQAIAVESHFTFPKQNINVNGGAIALGHPIGASGARILVSLVHELRRRENKHGLAALCIGGGQGVATIIEAV